MKIDDPRLEEKSKEAFARVQKIDDRMLTVIKNHLMLEQFMDEFLDASGMKHDEDRTFADKVELCKGLKPAEIGESIWEVLKKVNQLRNKIAHTPDQQEIQPKVDAVRKAYLEALTQQQAKHSEKLDDVRIVAGACGTCGGYLAAATEAAKQKKK